MNPLGIYFGPKVITIVQTKGKKVLNHIEISLSAIYGGELEEKVPYELKLVALFKDELRRNKIETRDATFCFSGQDLIIRTFEIPILPTEELASAVNFEAKKYIPFKSEDIVSDFQLKLDKLNRRNSVLFVGIKKEVLNKYISILNQLNLKINTLEYSAFSASRLLQLAGLKQKGVLGLLCADLREEDEVNFVVLENGFPLFSRDITLSTPTELGTKTENIEPGLLLEKLKTELRISLDFYNRKLPTKNIEKICLISAQDNRLDLETYIKELGLPTQFVEIAKFTGKPLPFSSSFIKGYGSSLSKVIKSSLKINLLAAKERMKAEVVVSELQREWSSLIAGLEIQPRVVIASLFICIAFYLFGVYRSAPLQKELTKIIGIQPKAISVKPHISYEELKSIDAEYKKKIAALDSLINKRFYLTKLLDAIPREIPQGLWLVDFSFKKEQDRLELILRGMAYLGDREKEWERVNNFLASLRKNAAFYEYFKEINIVSVEEGKTEKYSVTNFIISCRNY